MPTPIRNFRAPQRLWEAISAAAENAGVDRSEILRRAAASYEPIKRAQLGMSVDDAARQMAAGR